MQDHILEMFPDGERVKRYRSLSPPEDSPFGSNVAFTKMGQGESVFFSGKKPHEVAIMTAVRTKGDVALKANESFVFLLEYGKPVVLCSDGKKRKLKKASNMPKGASGELTFGRSYQARSGVDVLLETPEASNRHFTVWWEPKKQKFVIKNESKNGTYYRRVGDDNIKQVKQIHKDPSRKKPAVT